MDGATRCSHDGAYGQSKTASSRARSFHRNAARPGHLYRRGGGAGVDRFSVGDEVIGFTDKRAAQAELVLVDVNNLTPKPKNVPWEVAGSLYIAGTTAWSAVHSVQLTKSDTVVITAAAGGVGTFAVQLARRAGATVIGLASEGNRQWLQSHGVIPVAYGDDVTDRIKAVASGGIDALIDAYGDGYVELVVRL